MIKIMKTTKQQIETAFRDYLKAKGYVPIAGETKSCYTGVTCIIHGVDVNLKDFSHVKRSTKANYSLVGIYTKHFDDEKIHQNLFRIY